MKKIHLLCNAHLDPVWLWTRNEGIAEAISTFRVAAKFCEEYDNFIFNHNESVLYEWVEEHEPELFKKIQELVKKGKWRIMGGWYLQPDCVMPSGEGFLRQIETGNSYFKEKFGVKPTTAINFDPFGHTRGLVQILKKSGYDSYLFMRPHGVVGDNTDFIWKGFDGSEIIGHSMWGGYNSPRGKIDEKIDRCVLEAHDGANLLLWGVGNHGGGPSKIDLEKIEQYIKDHPDVIVEHSFCENYFNEIDKENLETFDKSLVHCMVGCYTSMVQIKRNYRALENELCEVEKMIAVSGIDYDKSLLVQAEKDLLFSQFHDCLPGSMIKDGETQILGILRHGRENVERLKAKAFFKLCEGQKAAIDGEIPVIVFNPHPYKIETEIQAEFQLADQNWNDNEVTLVKVKNEKGEYLPTQNEKESSSLTLDWRKRISFRAELEPMSINRFDCELYVERLDKRPIDPCKENETHFIFNNNKIEVLINKSTGLIDKYTVSGKALLSENSAKIDVFKDNEDPWGMTVDSFTEKTGSFTAMSKSEANAFAGYPDASCENVHVTENGAVRTKIQAVFKNQSSFAVLTYTLPKNDEYIDLKIKTLANEPNVLYKLSFNTALSNNSDFIGQTAFGKEPLLKSEKEVTFQKWCSLSDVENTFTVINNGTYAGSADNNILNITLQRTPVYSAHPIRDRAITDNDRIHDHIDMGEREFEYRLWGNCESVDAEAEIFNQPPYALSFFPSGAGTKPETKIELGNKSILLSCYKRKEDDSILIRLFNTSKKEEATNLSTSKEEFQITFTPFEVKGFIYKNGNLKECNLIGE